jgi:hypothetical protein
MGLPLSQHALSNIFSENLIPFTRWITPPNVPKRFTTQMYLYFLPITSAPDKIGAFKEAVIPTPTHDGGLEHTAAKFLPPSAWLDMAKSGEIIMFPPQFFLLTMISQFLKPTVDAPMSPETLEQQRKQLRQFVKHSRRDPSWGDACISPLGILGGKYGDGRAVLSLEKPGLDLAKLGRKGIKEYVVLVQFSKEGPRKCEVRLREEVLGSEGGKETGKL